MMNRIHKESLKQDIITSLSAEAEIEKIVIFGSFTHSDTPHDIDVAIFQNSQDDYLTLAMKYRRLTRHIARQLPLDIIPLKAESQPTDFLTEIESGEVVYERCSSAVGSGSE